MGLSRVWRLPPLFCGRDSASHFKSRSRPGSSGELNSAIKNDKKSYSRFQGGSPSGLSWFSLEGGGWLVGDLDQDGSYTGEAAYLYPDLSTAIVGKFDAGKLRVGREARLVGLDCDLGLLRPRWSSRNCDVRKKDVMSVLL